MTLQPEDVRVVLVSPEGEANMGAVARSMTCFGVSDLVLVTPYRTPAEEALAWACHGAPVLETHRTTASLDEALTGMNMAVGLTRRAGKRRHRMYTPLEFRSRVLPSFPPGRLALVFGTEECGLSNEELDRCHRLVRIPTLGSLNLSHAVTLMLYELFGREEARGGEASGTDAEPAAGGRPPAPDAFWLAGPTGLAGPGGPDLTRPSRPRRSGSGAGAPASPEMRLQMMEALTGHLRVMGYPFHRASLEEEMTKLGDILGRASLEEWETRFLLGMFKHLRVQFERLRKAGGTPVGGAGGRRRAPSGDRPRPG